MTILNFALLAGVVISIMIIYKYADKWIKRLPAGTIKTINWIGFSTAIVGGIVWYTTGIEPFMLVTLAGIVVYFLFYSYDKAEGNPGK